MTTAHAVITTTSPVVSSPLADTRCSRVSTRANTSRGWAVGHRISGYVVDAETGEPLAGKRIVVHSDETGRFHLTRTDGQGRFEFVRLSGTEFVLAMVGDRTHLSGVLSTQDRDDPSLDGCFVRHEWNRVGAQDLGRIGARRVDTDERSSGTNPFL